MLMRYVGSAVSFNKFCFVGWRVRSDDDEV